MYRGRSGHGSAYPAGTSQPAGDVGAGGAVVEVSGGPAAVAAAGGQENEEGRDGDPAHGDERRVGGRAGR